MHIPWRDRIATRIGISNSRRDAFKTLAGAALAGVLGVAAAPNASAACGANGARCTRGAGCCSGRCVRQRRRKGRPRRRFCRPAPSQGACTVEKDICIQGVANTQCGSANFGCFCFVTTSGASFCGDTMSGAPTSPACASNSDCAALGPAAVCIDIGSGPPNCIGTPTGGVCARPCQNPA
ncbi:MAG: hypothetical protein M3464_03850 [Chloroflexota bacterium]|nr:hypothetical protein [Chloroflexota bacterium]